MVEGEGRRVCLGQRRRGFLFFFFFFGKTEDKLQRVHVELLGPFFWGRGLGWIL